MISVIDRILISILAFLEGICVMSVIYDLKLKSYGMEFYNQIGMHGSVLIGIKIFFTIIIFIILICVIFIKRQVTNKSS